MRIEGVPSRQGFTRRWLVGLAAFMLQAVVLGVAGADTAPQGSQGGVLSTFSLPDKGKLIYIDVYFGNGTVSGIKFSYLSLIHI